MAFFTEIDKNDSKICMDLQRIVNSQSTQDKKEKAGGFTLSDFKPFYKAIAMKQHGVSEKETHRQMEYN